MNVRIGYFLTKAAFLILNKLSVNICLQTSFIDENILGMLPQSKKVIPYNSKPVSTPARRTGNADVTVVLTAASVAAKVQMTATKTEVALRLAKQTWLEPRLHRYSQTYT